MADKMSEEEFNFLLHEATKQIKEADDKQAAVELANYEAFLSEDEIPDFREAVDYMNLYNELKIRRGREGIKCPITNRKAIACKVAIRRKMEAENA